MESEQVRAAAVSDDVRSNRLLILAFLIAATVVNTSLAYIVHRVTFIPVSPVQISSVAVTGPSELCAGDTLEYEFVLSASKDANISLDSATYRESEPEGIAAWNDTRRMVLEAGAEATVEMRWFIPTVYWDWATGEERTFQPGEYTRLLSVGTTSRESVPAIHRLPFTVLDECP